MENLSIILQYPRYDSGRGSNLFDHSKYNSKHSRYAESEPIKVLGCDSLKYRRRIEQSYLVGDWYKKGVSVYVTTPLLRSKNN